MARSFTRGISHPGQHAAIIDGETFAQAGRLLDAAPARRNGRATPAAPLTGLLYDAAGNRMTPVHSKGRSGRRYRYYVSAPLQTGGEIAPSVRGRIPAARIEKLVLSHLRSWSGRPDADWPVFVPWLRRLEVHASALLMTICPPPHERWAERIDAPALADALPGGELRISVPAAIVTRGGRSRITHTGVIRINPDRALIAGLRRALATLADHGIDLLSRAGGFEEARGIDDPYLRSLASLAFLAPDIQHAILTGRQPDGVMLGQLLRADIPLCWHKQREMFGMSRHRPDQPCSRPDMGLFVSCYAPVSRLLFLKRPLVQHGLEAQNHAELRHSGGRFTSGRRW